MFGFGSRSLALLALGLGTFACGEDVDPLASTGPSASGSGAVSSASNGSSNGSNTNDDTDGGPATGGTATGEPTTGEPTTGGGATMEVCQRFIQCVALTVPADLPDAQAGFGADSACWSGSPADAELCIQACQTALGQAHELFPEEDACDQCLSDGDCDQAAGETCIDGGCTPPCGDGKVGPGEVCDGQLLCDDDCLGPLECNPIDDFGCTSPMRCSLVDGGGGWSTTCIEEDFPPGSVVDVGERCGYIDAATYHYCGFGRDCLSALQFDLPCDVQCCVAYCNLTSPQPCPDGYTCVPYEDATGEDVSDPLSYLGLCLP